MVFRFLLFLLAAVLLPGCGGPKQSPREAAAEFFERCASGQSAAAYQSASKLFQLERSQKYFEARVRDLGLDRIKTVEWSEPQKRAETQRLDGTFTVADGGKFTLLVSMVEEGGAWRLLSAKQEVNGKIEDVFAVLARSEDSQSERKRDFLEPVATTLPSDRQLQQLVDKTLVDFNDAIRRAEFDDFFGTVSDRWKYRGKDPRQLNYAGSDPRRYEESDPMNRAGRLTVQALKREFHPFVEARVDLSSVKGKKMILDQTPQVSSDGVLTLVGRYAEFVFQGAFPPQPRKLTFKLEYVFEGSSWRLFGITLKLDIP